MITRTYCLACSFRFFVRIAFYLSTLLIHDFSVLTLTLNGGVHIVEDRSKSY